MHNVLQTTCMIYSVFSCWNVLILIFSVFVCIIGSKRVVFEKGVGGGLGVLPQNFFSSIKPVFIQIGDILCNNDGYEY